MRTEHRENPFPGIDPWMQSKGSDVHTRLISYLCDQLASTLPDDLVARAEENMAMQAPGQPPEARRIDAGVVDGRLEGENEEAWRSGERLAWKPENSSETASRIVNPALVHVEPETERWVEIRTSNGKLVTVIEILSLANKTREGRALEEEDLQWARERLG